MLQSPELSFIIPSIHDDTPLDCRLYHPLRPIKVAIAERSKCQNLGVILAHPYGPLGGCYDDPVVQAVAAELLACGFVVGTFNFRGAGSSKGRTSWTSKPELEDYISFAGFFVHYLHGLEPLYSDKQAGIAQPAAVDLSSALQSSYIFESSRSNMVLILGGYSYGSLVTTNLPTVDDILSHFVNVVEGTAEAEIRLRALHLSTRWNKEVQYHDRLERERELTVEPSLPATHSITVGGDESQPGTRRASRESRHSPDVVRHSIDRSRIKLGFGTHSSEDISASSSIEQSLPTVEIPEPQVNYLLISPLLPPVSMLLTMFAKPISLGRSQALPHTKVSKGRTSAPLANLVNHPTLAVYGDKDLFTSPKKLRHWAEMLANTSNSRFRFQEIAGAGHFWHEEGVEEQMRSTIRSWVKDIVQGMDDV